MFFTISRRAALFVALHAMGQAACAGIASGAIQGLATWHDFGEKTACPGSFGTTNVVALRTDLFRSAKSQCGMCTQVTGKKGSVVVMLVDECVGSACKELDISKDAFGRIADISEGITDVKFSDFAPCEQLQGRLTSAKLTSSGSENEIAELIDDSNSETPPDVGRPLSLESEYEVAALETPPNTGDSSSETSPNVDRPTGLEVEVTTASSVTTASPAATASPVATATPTVAGTPASPSPPVQNEVRNDQGLPSPTSAAEKFGLPAIFGSLGTVLMVQLVTKALV